MDGKEGSVDKDGEISEIFLKKNIINDRTRKNILINRNINLLNIKTFSHFEPQHLSYEYNDLH